MPSPSSLVVDVLLPVLTGMPHAYESRFAAQVGAAHAVAFGFARVALRSILQALGLESGDEVVLSPLTCKAVPLALLSIGVQPIYADIAGCTLNLDPERARAAIGPRTKAILFQHTYGHPGGLAEISQIAGEYGIPLIEDCAQSMPIGGVGITGKASIFSNNLLKPLPAASGGMAVTNDAVLAEKLLYLRDCFPQPGASAMMRLRLESWIHHHVLRPEVYWLSLSLFSSISSGYRERPLDDEIATEVNAIPQTPGTWQFEEGARWLDKGAEWAALRRVACDDYRNALTGCPGVELPVASTAPLYYFPVRTKHKTAILDRARRERVEMIAWPRTTPIYPIVSESQLRVYGFDPATCPAAVAAASELIGLPTHDRITPRHRQQIAGLLRSAA